MTAPKSAYRPAPRGDTLIRGATLLDGAGRRIDEADVIVAGGRIAELGSGLTRPRGTTVVEAERCWLTPGLVDPHSHAGTFPAPYVEAELDYLDVNEATLTNAAKVRAEESVTAGDPTFLRALAGGVTTLNILPGSLSLFPGQSVVLKNLPATTVQAMIFPGARRGLKMSCGENPKRHFGARDHFPSSRMGVLAGQREIWAKAKAYADGRPRDARIDPDLEPLAAALNGEMTVHIHAYRADDMATQLELAAEFGYRIGAFHHALEAYKIAPLLAVAGVSAIVWSDWWGFKGEALDGVRENAAFLEAAGVNVALHSDIPQIGPRLAIEAGKAMAAGRRAGVPVAHERAIAWITLNAAKVLGIEGETGSVEIGKSADLALWSGDPFSVYSQAMKVFLDGALIFDRDDPERRPLADLELGQAAAGNRH